jgi:hypothetical protein
MFPYDQRLEPPCPRVRIRITDRNRSISFLFAALVDTGADQTCVPESVGGGNPNISYDICTVWGEPRELIRIPSAYVELMDEEDNVLFASEYKDLKLPVMGEELAESVQRRKEVIGYIGRDLLNSHVCQFTGRSLSWHIAEGNPHDKGL